MTLAVEAEQLVKHYSGHGGAARVAGVDVAEDPDAVRRKILFGIGQRHR